MSSIEPEWFKESFYALVSLVGRTRRDRDRHREWKRTKARPNRPGIINYRDDLITRLNELPAIASRLRHFFQLSGYDEKKKVENPEEGKKKEEKICTDIKIMFNTDIMDPGIETGIKNIIFILVLFRIRMKAHNIVYLILKEIEKIN